MRLVQASWNLRLDYQIGVILWSPPVCSASRGAGPADRLVAGTGHYGTLARMVLYNTGSTTSFRLFTIGSQLGARRR